MGPSSATKHHDAGKIPELPEGAVLCSLKEWLRSPPHFFPWQHLGGDTHHLGKTVTVIWGQGGNMSWETEVTVF